jgi:pimeloyl-ACP methyl ester carboxylesterase
LLLFAAAPARAAIAYVPCAVGGVPACASLGVPLDRSGRTPGTVPLSVERRLAGATPSHTAVIALVGGPGQATLPLAPYIAEAIAPALGTRDLLLFDQRGTGASGPLTCPAFSNQAEVSGARGPSELIQHCAQQLGPGRGSYTTRESVEDVEAIRQAAGYEKLVLYGTSYGTKVALEYAERYPQRVESLVLDSTETPEGPEPFHISTFKAMRPMLRELCSSRACQRVSSDPLRELARLVEALGAQPLTGHVFDGAGKRRSIQVTSRDLFQLLLAGDLNPAIRAQLPAVVHSAVRRDAAPLARLVALAALHAPAEGGSELNFTLFLTTSCEETPFPWQRSAPEATRAVEAERALNALPRSDFYPFDPESGLFDETIPLCVSWPDASATPPPVGALPNVPTLILSGAQDLRTPTENARLVASLIPDAQLVQVPYTGHSVIGTDLSGCARAALTSFFAGAAVSACAPGVNRFRVTPLPPRQLSDLAPARGLSGSPGRTVGGVLDSLLDLRRTVITVGLDFGGVPYGARFGGLRGGSVAVTRAGALLRRFSYVPGLELTGLVPTGILLKDAGKAANLAIGGPAATAGRLRVASGGRLSGTLAGRSFHVSAAAKLKVAAGAGALGGGGEAWPPSLPPAFPEPRLRLP